MKRREFIAALPAAAAVRGAEAVRPAGDLILWYRQPAAKWEEALPVGNGRMGAMVFGAVGKERLQLNEDSIWAGKAADNTNPEALKALPQVRTLLFEGKELEATKLAAATMMGRPERVESYQPLCDLWIELEGLDGQITAYRRWLDLESGVAVTEFTAGEVTITREVFASAVDDMIHVRIAASAPVNIRIRMTRQEGAQCVSAGKAIELSGGLQSVRYEARVEGAGLTSREGILSGHGREFVLAVQSRTSWRPGRAWRAFDANWSGLRSRHESEHRSWMKRVSLTLTSDPDLDQLPTDERITRVKSGGLDTGLEALHFQYGRYLLLGSSRPGTLPANLQGIWNEHLKAPWNSDYHTNINIQMNYWPADVTNLSECHRPLFDWMESVVESGRRTAKAHYGAGGWVVHHLSDLFGYTAPADGIWGVWPMGAAWLARHPWEHYRFTGDKAWFRRQGYPLMKGAAEFVLDFLVEAPEGTPVAGRLVPCPSHSPENRFRKADGTESMFTYAATMDVEICFDVLTNTAAGARALGVDGEFARRCEEAARRLPELKISLKSGRLQEWVEDYDEPEPKHRHVSHGYGLHPGEQISVTRTPQLADAFRKTLEARGDLSTGWSTAWKMNFWARLRDGERAHRLFQNLLGKCTLPNLFDTHPPFQIDGNFGATAGVAEMLVQSHAGEIHLLPAVPKAWSRGRVRGLKARGGFEIEMEWRDSRVVRAQLKSGESTSSRVRVNGKTLELKTKPGEWFSLVV